jgi:hypothetical protein
MPTRECIGYMGAAHETDDGLLLSGDPEDFGRFYDRC